MSSERDGVKRKKEKLTPSVEGKSEGRGLPKKEGGGGRLLVALAQTFTFFTSSPLSRWFLKSAMAVPARGWLIFVRSPRSLDLSLLLKHSLSDSLRALFFSLFPPIFPPVSSFSLWPVRSFLLVRRGSSLLFSVYPHLIKRPPPPATPSTLLGTAGVLM